MPSGARTPDPPFVGAFMLEIDGLEIGRFTEITGLSVQMEVEEVKEGGNNEATIKLPGRLTWPNIVLKRGITDNDSLMQWILACSGEGLTGEGNKVTRRNGRISLLDATAAPVRTWNITAAMPVKWTGPQLSAGGNSLATEELEVGHGGFRA